MLLILFLEPHGQPSRPAFPTTSGAALSHDGLQYLLNKRLAVACRQCASLSGKHVTPHVLRHTLAMELLHHGVDRSVIALWLGHRGLSRRHPSICMPICNSRKLR